MEAKPCLNEIETVQPATSAPIMDEMESTGDQVQDAAEKPRENDIVQSNGKSCDKSLEIQCNVYTVYHYS